MTDFLGTTGLLPAGAGIPWLDFVGFFLLIAGFVIGLGSVTVIDIHAWCGRTSAYWTEAATRTHKVTKPLIWAGLCIAFLGAAIVYRKTGLEGIALWQALIATVLVLNGAYLTFMVSPFLLRQEQEGSPDRVLPPELQRKIFASFALSFLLWWLELLLTVWYLVVLH